MLGRINSTSLLTTKKKIILTWWDPYMQDPHSPQEAPGGPPSFLCRSSRERRALTPWHSSGGGALLLTEGRDSNDGVIDVVEVQDVEQDVLQWE
jgi:hypothetical protein